MEQTLDKLYEAARRIPPEAMAAISDILDGIDDVDTQIALSAMIVAVLLKEKKEYTESVYALILAHQA